MQPCRHQGQSRNHRPRLPQVAQAVPRKGRRRRGHQHPIHRRHKNQRCRHKLPFSVVRIRRSRPDPLDCLL
jgi:hypothetical protein